MRWPEASIGDYFLRFLQGVENTAAHSFNISKAYNYLFYRHMVFRELKKSDLQTGDRVLHIGSGALPLTGIILAQQGIFVRGVDYSERAIRAARQLVKKYELQEMIEFQHQEARNMLKKAATRKINAANYLDSWDGVWISLHVFPKKEIIQKLCQLLAPGTKIIYRNSRGWLERFYVPVAADELGCVRSKKVSHNLGKESIIFSV